MADAKPKETTESDDEMVAVQWVTHEGDRAHTRRITKQDWKGVGVDHDTVEWDRTDPLTEGQAWVSTRAALYLEKAEQGFKKVTEDKLAFNLQK